MDNAELSLLAFLRTIRSYLWTIRSYAAIAAFEFSPRKKKVYVYRPGFLVEGFNGTETVSGEPLLKSFAPPVAKL